MRSTFSIGAVGRKQGFWILLVGYILLLLSIIQIVYATEWQNIYVEGYATTVVQTVDGGYALAGNANGNFSLIKVNSLGNLEWSRIYDIQGSLGATDLVQTQDGGYAMAGGGGNFLLVKTDAQGNLEWWHSYGEPAEESRDQQAARALIQTVDGGYALVGFSIRRYSVWSGDYEAINVDLDFWLVKTDAEGNMLWDRTYDSGGKDHAYDLVQTQDAGYMMVGSGLGLVKTNSSGNIEWYNTVYGAIYPEIGPRALIQTSDGGYTLVGGSFIGGGFVLSKANARGDMEWQYTFGGKLARSLIEVSDGYIICGEDRLDNPRYPEGWGQTLRLTKTDLNGREVWTRDFVGRGFCVIQTVDNGLVAVGQYPANIWDLEGNGWFYMIKTDATGLTAPLDLKSDPPPITSQTGEDFSIPWYFKWILLLTLTVIGALILTAYVVANRKSKSTIKGLNGK